jgi:hypothetical protein
MKRYIQYIQILRGSIERVGGLSGNKSCASI